MTTNNPDSLQDHDPAQFAATPLPAAMVSSPEWVNGKTGFRHRAYGSYEEYLKHQSQKLRGIQASNWLTQYEERFYKVLLRRLHASPLPYHGKSVLCIGARQGAEVRVFRSLGCFAVGIDINPGENNNLVLHGDFHKLQFASGTVDFAFTNALDHAFDLSQCVAEIGRVLRVGGTAIIEIMRGALEGNPNVDQYDCLHWKKIEQVTGIFTDAGFSRDYGVKFRYPWRGEHIRLTKLLKH